MILIEDMVGQIHVLQGQHVTFTVMEKEGEDKKKHFGLAMVIPHGDNEHQHLIAAGTEKDMVDLHATIWRNLSVNEPICVTDILENNKKHIEVIEKAIN